MFQVFSRIPSTLILEKLSDALQLSASVTRLFVFEIKQRASHSNAMDAAAAIMDWLSPPKTAASPPSDERSDSGDAVDGGGWLLLNALSLFALGTYELVLSLVQNALPSTLLKCLYIFPELPAISSAPVSDPAPAVATSASVPARPEAEAEAEAEAERRLLVHKLFAQVSALFLFAPLSICRYLYCPLQLFFLWRSPSGSPSCSPLFVLPCPLLRCLSFTFTLRPLPISHCH